MQVLTRKKDMLVVGVFGDTDRILLEKTMVITPKFNMLTVNVNTSKLYRGVFNVPIDLGTVEYFYNGKTFMKVPQ